MFLSFSPCLIARSLMCVLAWHMRSPSYPRRPANRCRNQVQARAIFARWDRHLESAAIHGTSQHIAAPERDSPNHCYFAPFVGTRGCQRTTASVPGAKLLGHCLSLAVAHWQSCPFSVRKIVCIFESYEILECSRGVRCLFKCDIGLFTPATTFISSF